MATATATVTTTASTPITTTTIAAAAAAAETSAVQSKKLNHSIQLLHANVSISGMPHGLGLLTTVASLPPKYRSRYLSINTTKSETPLDLSVKPISPQIANDVPIAASFTEVYTEPCSEPEIQTNIEKHYTEENSTASTLKQITTIDIYKTNSSDDITKSPITPPPTPTKRKLSEQSLNNEEEEAELMVEQFIKDNYTNPVKMAKTNEYLTTKRDSTPAKPIKSNDTAPKTIKAQLPATKLSKNKATRKLKFDEETSSPVSGTIIRPLEDITDGTVQYSNGDIDPKYNIVEITEETKAELAAIKNVIGDYICRLCRLKFDDAFGLAQHRCACIVLLEYRCPECGKQFNCPANLASHRRWHKPKKEAIGGYAATPAAATAKKENRNTTNTVVRQAFMNEQQRRNDLAATTLTYACEECGKGFKRQAYLRKHLLTHVTGGGGVIGGAGVSVAAVKKSRAECVATKTVRITSANVASTTTTTTNTTNISSSAAYQAYNRVGSSSAASLSSSSSSQHSYSGASSMIHEDDVGVTTYMINGSNAGTNTAYDYDIDSMSDCSNSSTGYGRLQIVESGLTEEENIAAAALTNLRNCASVIQHTTLAH